MQSNAVNLQRNVQRATCKVPCAMCNLENIAHVGSYRNLKIHLKKFVHVCVVNVIHAKVLPGSVL